MKVLGRIKEYRKRKHLSQEDMSDRLGMSQNNYGKIERGDTEITVGRLIEIANILEVPVFELVGEDINEVIELIKQSYEIELQYYKIEDAKNKLLIKNMREDLNLYRKILFEKGLIDVKESKRDIAYIVAEASIISSVDNMSDIEELVKRKD